MNMNGIKASLDQLAKQLGCEVRQSRKQATLFFLDLEIAGIEGQVRLLLDMEDAVVISEVAVPFSTLLPPDVASAETLFALHMMLSPPQSGLRFFPTLDMQREHVLISCVIGSEAVRDSEGISQFLWECATRVAALVNEVSLTLRTKQVEGKYYASSAHFLNRLQKIQ